MKHWTENRYEELEIKAFGDGIATEAAGPTDGANPYKYRMNLYKDAYQWSASRRLHKLYRTMPA